MSLNDILKSIEKQYGKGSIFCLGSSEQQEISGVSTGLLSLDKALGGCVPFGRITEFYGSESSGKTSLALSVIAQAQKENLGCAYIDAEHSLNLNWAKTLGVDVDKLLFSQPNCGEQALDIVESLINSGEVKVIVIDSVSALIPRAELEGEIGDAHIGLQARLMSQAMRKLSSVINQQKVIVIFINQIRMKIGVMFGSPETTSGGRALKFYASLRVDIRRISNIKDSTGVAAAHVRARVVKNKIAAPFREAEFDIYFDEGLSFEADLIDYAISQGVIEKSGGWFNYKDTKIQGKENLRQTLKENPKLVEQIGGDLK